MQNRPTGKSMQTFPAATTAHAGTALGESSRQDKLNHAIRTLAHLRANLDDVRTQLLQALWHVSLTQSNAHALSTLALDCAPQCHSSVFQIG